MQVKLIIRKERFCGYERELSILFLASFQSLLEVVWTCLGTQWSLLTLLLRLSNSSSQHQYFDGLHGLTFLTPTFSGGPSPFTAILFGSEGTNRGFRQNEIVIFFVGVQFEGVCNHMLLIA